MVKAKPGKIAFVKELVKFGEEKLSLNFAGSFRKVDRKKKTANWLYVVHPDKLESALPNNETFLFFWDLGKARRKQTFYRKKGFHTYLYRAEAHGGGKCPITPMLLAATGARQGYVVLHEAWHSTCWSGGIRMPYALEEATGRVVGVMGAVMFAEKTGDVELIRECRNQARDWERFARFINRGAKALDKIYGKKPFAKERNVFFRKAREEADRLRDKTKSPWEKEELTREMNNALFFRYRDYTLHYPLALRIYKSSRTLVSAMNKYKHAARKGTLNMLMRME
ncbi:MAG: hypothetical protein E3J72_16900 [Planctomycetota bacterium]|nr:MAG: hypothetical protein E3J72_16900 [Planctomycetota bacterium]